MSNTHSNTEFVQLFSKLGIMKNHELSALISAASSILKEREVRSPKSKDIVKSKTSSKKEQKPTQVGTTKSGAPIILKGDKRFVSKSGKSFRMKRRKTRPLAERQALNWRTNAAKIFVDFCKSNGIEKGGKPSSGQEKDYNSLLANLTHAKTYLASVKEAIKNGKEHVLIHEYRKQMSIPVFHQKDVKPEKPVISNNDNNSLNNKEKETSDEVKQDK